MQNTASTKPPGIPRFGASLKGRAFLFDVDNHAILYFAHAGLVSNASNFSHVPKKFYITTPHLTGTSNVFNRLVGNAPIR